MKRYHKTIDGRDVMFGGILIREDIQIVNPSEAELEADGWTEWVEPEPQPSDPTEDLSYEDYVNSLIREKYSVSEEFAILRQRDTKPEEYAEYFAFCEECKKIAKAKYEGDAE